MTEAIFIAEGGGGARLLNKQEFGANLILEVVVMRGDQVLGRGGHKRKREDRGGASGIGTSQLVPTNTIEMGSEGSEMEAAGATAVKGGPKRKRREDNEREETPREEEGAPNMEGGGGKGGEYSHITDKELREELKSRRFKVKGRGREEMIILLEEDNRNQKKLVLSQGHWRGQGGRHQIRGEEGGREEGKGGGDTTPNTGEEGEDNWVDVDPPELTDNGRGTEEAACPNEGLRRISPSKNLGRLRGQGRRGYWVGRRAQQIQGRMKSTRREALVSKDSKESRETRAEGVELGTEAGTGAEVTTCATSGAKSAERDES